MTDSKEPGTPTTRNAQVDFLRILAALGVVCIHACAHIINFYSDALSPVQLKLVWSIDMIMGNNWSVPCFFMISGAFMLSSKSDVPLGAFYRKRLPRILVPLLFWNLVYFVISWKLSGYNVSLSEGIRRMCNNGNYHHLWYLYALTSLYVFAPFLRKTVASCTRLELNLLVCMGFLLAFVRVESDIPILLGMGGHINNIGYFLAGYLFLTYPLRGNKMLLFGVLLCGNVLCLRMWLGSDGWYFGRIFVSSAVFILCVQNISIPEKMIPWVRYLASLTFGIYLVHPIWLIITQRVLSNKFSVMNGWEFILRIPIEIFVVFICSAITAAVMLRIPFLRRTI